MSPFLESVLSQLTQTLLVVVLAPAFLGWLNQCRAWLQNRSGAGMLQPYRVMSKLFHKDAVLAKTASPVFRASPYVQFSCMVLAASIVPVIETDLAFSPAADVIALVGIFALARVFAALAAMDIGTAFGTMGARREMLVASLSEPALLMVFFTPLLIAQSTSLTAIADALAHRQFAIYPSLAFAAVAFVMVLLAENARIPIDNPSTHLELTMIHEGALLEYAGRDLAYLQWAGAARHWLVLLLAAQLFLPHPHEVWAQLALLPLVLVLLCAALAIVETLVAKMRILLAPRLLGAAAAAALLGVVARQVGVS
ncbi:MAG: respiratory chain complex I subunit 1 family protein [Burkholderiales bacterium]